MKTSLDFAIVAFLCALVFSPGVSAARTFPNFRTASSTAQYESSGTTPAQQQMMQGWRQSSGLQQAIAALGTVPIQALPMPVLFGVAPSDLTPNFGDPRDNGTRTHEGEDIMAVKGTPIVSPTAAVVLKTETGVSEGNAIYTANPGGESFVYMHLDRFGEGVVAGEVLQPGSLIGYVGNTGDAAGGPAHLHFEVHNSAGVPTDPFPRLTAEFTAAQKISFLATILTQTSDPTSLSQFLALNFRSVFLADLAANIPVPIPILSAVASLPAVSLSRDLDQGMTGEDVRALQALLNADGYAVASTGAGSPGNETTYFGPATQAAVIRFQLARGISPAAGYVGPITRKALGI